jgi:hypothetical protein
MEQHVADAATSGIRQRTIGQEFCPWSDDAQSFASANSLVDIGYTDQTPQAWFSNSSERSWSFQMLHASSPVASGLSQASYYADYE